MRRVFAFAVVLAIGSFGLLTTASGATTRYVDDSNCPGPGTGSKNNPFCSINTAIGAANPGDTIKVRAGRYTELVVVNKTLTLLGAQAGRNPVKRNRTNNARESILGDPAGSNGPITLAANNVTVDGFTIRDAWTCLGNQANVWTSPLFSGYRILNNHIRGGSMGINMNTSEAGAGSTVARNRFANNSEPGCAASGSAIYSDTNLDNVSIRHNRFLNHLNVAIGINGANNTGVTISKNFIDSAIYLQNTKAKISLNTLRNSNTHGIQLATNNDGTVIHRNTIISSEWSAIRLTTGNDGVSITKNRIEGSGIEGIHLGSSTDASSIRKNVIKGVTSRGIFVEVGSEGNFFTKNTVKRSASGLDIDDDTTGGPGTDGTDNTYTSNACGTSDPATICD